jgi:methionyl-tRNA formyltransferase
VSAESWRVVFVSQYLPGLLALDRICREAGHRPVAHLFVRGFKQETVAPLHEQLKRLVTESPPGLALLVPARKSQIAPLLDACEPDLLICGGFPWLIPQEALAVLRLGAINIHPSLLPKYRGPLPLHWALRNGDTELGATIHRMDESFDTGPILAQGTVPIDDDDGEEELYRRLGSVLDGLLHRALARVAARDPGDPQDEGSASYAGFMEDAYKYVDWSRSARRIHNQARVWRFHPPTEGPKGPIAELDGDTVRILRTRLTPGEGREVQCGDGPLWVVETEPVE